MADRSDTVRIAAGKDLFRLTTNELDTLASTEHESWRRHHDSDGWSYAENRDNAEKKHPSLRPWRELDAADKNKTRAGVIDTLFQLCALGYRSEPTTPGHPSTVAISVTGP